MAEIDRAQQRDGAAFAGFLRTDERGKAVVSTGRQMTLSRADSGALSFVGTFPIPSGTYLMKFAAVHDGRVGSVEHRGSAASRPPTSRAALEQAKSGRFDEALRQLKPDRPGDPTAPFLRGLSLFAKGQLQPASDAFRAAIAAAPELLVGAFYIGACYAAGGSETHAINAWQTSLIGLAQYQAVYRFLADALIRAGQWERARALLAEAAARWPDDHALRARAMRASLEAGRYDQALEYADRLIERQPSDSALLFLAMRSIFQAVLEGVDVRADTLLSRLERYRDLYVASGGPQQALVAEWVTFVKSRVGVRS